MSDTANGRRWRTDSGGEPALQVALFTHDWMTDSARSIVAVRCAPRMHSAPTMYQPRTRHYDKRDMVKRWALPNRVFFACGACHILAFAFLERYGRPGMRALWIKPAPGHTGSHIFVEFENRIFDYHGYSQLDRYLTRYFRRAQQRYPGWDASIIELPADVLVSERKSRMYDGLWLREPAQFLHDALPRARAFLSRFPVP